MDSSLGTAATLQSELSQKLNDQRVRDAAQLILKKNYNNLRKLCEHQCKCFTGPHSVLQIFIEKIVKAIESFSQKLQTTTKDELLLWSEVASGSEEEKEKHLICGIDLNLILDL